jgi:adenylosuccinate synthase
MNSLETRRIYNSVQEGYDLDSPFLNSQPLILALHKRPHSISIGDLLAGDGGKGATEVKTINSYLQVGRKVFLLRANGGANAGHETRLNGQLIVTHLLPSGTLFEGVTSVMSRGMIIHPRDLLLEIDTVAEQMGGHLPSNPLIDRNAILGLDTHRALELAIKKLTGGGDGATGKGIGPAYASFLERTAVFVDDLLADDWDTRLRGHYRYTNDRLRGYGEEHRLENVTVSALDDPKGKNHSVGNEDEFIRRLSKERESLQAYVPDDMQEIIEENWNNHEVAFIAGFGQGALLDPWFGIYNDVTGSRTTSRNLPDVTYNIVEPEEIAIRATVFKTIYMSSVGTRRLPEIEGDNEVLETIGDEQREFGKTTGRPRPPRHIPLPAMQAMIKASGDEVLIPTHVDASREGRNINIITAYADKVTKVERPYTPMQRDMDKLEVKDHVVFEGYDGEAIAGTSDPAVLDERAKKVLAFYGKTVAPIAMVTTGQNPTDLMSWVPKEQFPGVNMPYKSTS